MGAALALALSGLAVDGCGLPAVVAVASYTADGMSLIGTGKSISDHALSTVVDRDCALWRIIRGGAICLEPAGTPVVVAAVPPGEDAAPAGADEEAPAPAVPPAPVPPSLPAFRSAAVPTQVQALLLAGPPPLPPPARAVPAAAGAVPPPRAKPPAPVELAEGPTPPPLPPQR